MSREEIAYLKKDIVALIYKYREPTMCNSEMFTLQSALDPKQIIEEAQQIFDWVMKK